MNFIERLWASKELKFSDGEIDLLGSRVLLVQIDPFAEYSLRINESPEKIFEFYDSIKTGFKEATISIMGKTLSFDFHNFFNWLTDISNLTGWGKLSWENLNPETKSGKITLTNSPIALNLKGKVKSPVDHMVRGFIAGGASAALKADLDVVEEECVASGSSLCKFTFGPLEGFDFSKPEVARQLGMKKQLKDSQTVSNGERKPDQPVQ